MMMLHTKLSRAGCLLPLYSSSATAAFKLCGHVRVNVCRYSSEATTRAKDIFPASSALIDEPVEKIHSHMAKLTANVNKEHKTRGLERFSARLHKELNQDSPSPKINSSVFVGHIVEFAHRGSFEVGFVSSHSEGAITVSLVNDQTLRISPLQVVSVWPHETNKVSLEELKSLNEQLPSFLESQPIRKRDLTDAWKKMCLFTQIPYTSELLSKILFNSNSPLSIYATFRMMVTSPYFKRWDNNSNGYKMYRADGLKGAKLSEFVEKIQQKLSGADSGSGLLPNWDRVNDTEFLGDLEAFARKGFEVPKGALATAKYVLQRVGKEFTPESSLALLKQIGASADTNTRAPFLNSAVTPQAKEQANTILNFVNSTGGHFTNITKSEFPDVDSSTRKDLTSHTVLTVDTEALAVDTGVSMHVSEDGQASTIYLHVADPTRWLGPKDPISDSAYLSGSSLYFPDGTTHMLPTNFLKSTSLSDTRDNYCLTFALNVNTNTGELQSYQIFSSVIGRVTQVSFKGADLLFNDQQVTGIDNETNTYFASLLQNLHTLKEARLANAPYRLPSVVPLQLDAAAKHGVTISEHGVSRTFQALHYVTVLANEAVSRFTEEHDLPLPSQPNATRPLRSFAGMLSHWQIKAVIRKASLPFSNTEMDGMRKYLATKTTSNEQDVALKKDEWAQKALRTFYENQRKVVGNDTVFVVAKVIKKDPVKRTINISVREFRYKSVLQLAEENYRKVETGGSVLLRMRERPTHIGMSFVSVVPSKTHSLDIPTARSKAQPEGEGPVLTFGSEPEVSTATLANTARQVYSNRQASAAGFPITGLGSRIFTSVATPVMASTSLRMFSSTARLHSDAKARPSIPKGMRIAQAQRGVTSDDFSDSAAPFEPYMFDLDPEDLLPRPPRVPVPPKPSRALKSRSRSMILNPIRREDDNTPLPEGSPTHIAIPAAVARAQAAAAAKAAAKEVKEAAKTAAKASGTKDTKAKKTTKDADKDAAPAADAANAGATPATNPIPASTSTTPHAAGPLGTTTPSVSTTVGAAPTPNNPARSYSILARPLALLSPYFPLSLSVPTFPSTAVRTYAGRKKTPNDDVPEPKSDIPSTPTSTGAQSQKGKAAPPIADDDDEDDKIVDDDDDATPEDDDDDEEKGEDDDEKVLDEDGDEKDDDEKDDDEKVDDDDDEKDDDDDEIENEEDELTKLQSNDAESDELDTVDAEDDELMMMDDEDEPPKKSAKAKKALTEDDDDDDEDVGGKRKKLDDDEEPDDFMVEEGEGEDDEEEDLPKKFSSTDKKFTVSEAAAPLAGAAALGAGAAMAAGAASRAGTVTPPVTPAPPAKSVRPPAKPSPATAKPPPVTPAPAPTRGRGRPKVADKAPETIGNEFEEGKGAKKPAAKRGPKK